MSLSCGLGYMLVVQMFCGLVIFFVGAGNNYLAPFINQFLNESFYAQFDVALQKEGLGLLFGAVTAAQYVGNIAGILTFANIVDNLGRRNTATLVLNALLIPSCILLTIAQPTGIWEFYLLGRLIYGFSASILNAAALFIGECAPDRLRGASIIIVMCGGILWSIAGNILAQPRIFGTQDNWHYYFLIALPISLLHIILGFTLHKSPKFLFIEKDDRTAAERSLKFYHGADVDFDSQFDHYEHEAALTPAADAMKLSTIWNTSHLRKTFLLCLVLALYPVYSGDVVLVQYTNIVLQEFGLSQSVSMHLMLIISVIGAVLIVFSSICIIERFNRRTLVFAGHGITMAMAISLCAAFAFGTNFMGYFSLALSLLCMVVIMILGGGTVGNVFFTELTPQIARAKITQICLLIRYIDDFSVLLAFPALFSIGGGYTFLSFVVPTIFVIIWLFRNLPESRNRPADEIVAEMIQNNNGDEESEINRSSDNYGAAGPSK